MVFVGDRVLIRKPTVNERRRYQLRRSLKKSSDTLNPRRRLQRRHNIVPGGPSRVMSNPQHAADVNGGNHGSVDKPKLEWGAAAIGKVINRTPRQTHHMLTRGYIKSARRIGGRWCASPAALLKKIIPLRLPPTSPPP